MCSVGSFWFNVSKFPDCHWLTRSGLCFYSLSKMFPCLRGLCHYAKDCRGCVNLKGQCSNGDDPDSYCLAGKSVTSGDIPLFPCDKKRIPLDVLNEKFARKATI